MTLKEFFAAELDREVERSRRALQQLPEGKADWKPHDKSMKFEYLADMVATMPSWVAMQITQDSLDIAPADGSASIKRTRKVTAGDHVKALDEAAETARAALARHDRRTSREQLAAQGAGNGGAGRPSPSADPGHVQSLGAPSRADDGVFAVDGREGAVALRTLRRRSELRVAHAAAARQGARDDHSAQRRHLDDNGTQAAIEDPRRGDPQDRRAASSSPAGIGGRHQERSRHQEERVGTLAVEVKDLDVAEWATARWSPAAAAAGN